MKLLVFGATGETGRELVKQSLKLGHFVTVLVRDLQKMDIRYVVPGGGGGRKPATPTKIRQTRCYVFV